MSEENQAVVRRWVEEVQNQRRLEVMSEIFEPGIVNHNVSAGLPVPQGIDGVREFFAMMFAAFPDFHVEIEDQIAEGDKVVTRKTFTGTHQGELLGMPPTGKQVEMQVIDIFRVVDGKCTDHWSVEDQLGLMQQLGVLSSPGQQA